MARVSFKPSKFGLVKIPVGTNPMVAATKLFPVAKISTMKFGAPPKQRKTNPFSKKANPFFGE
jgi:hypothetical protein